MTGVVKSQEKTDGKATSFALVHFIFRRFVDESCLPNIIRPMGTLAEARQILLMTLPVRGVRAVRAQASGFRPLVHLNRVILQVWLTSRIP